MIKSYFYTIALLLMASVIFQSCHDAKAETSPISDTELPSLQGKKVLMVWGGWDGHQPEVFTKKIKVLLEKEGASVIVSETVEIYNNGEVMSSLDLIIQSITMDYISNKAFNGLNKAVKGGVGFAGAHGGLCDAFRNHTEYQYMTGGQFVKHPGGQIDYTVNIVDHQDPITRDIKDFNTHTEQYYMHIDPNMKILATTTFNDKYDPWIKGAIIPIAWKKYHDEGRVFYISLGHNPEEFDVEPAQTFLMNGLKWASGSKNQPKEEWLSPIYGNMK